jgi:LysR family transcriptional regulator, cell division regulator
MNISDLEVFKSVATHKSISKAAVRLNYVQANVSNRIKKIESVFQTQLFYRTGRGVELTPKGKDFLEYAKKILALYEEMKQSIHHLPPAPDSLAVGATVITSNLHMSPIISLYHQLHPQVNLSLSTGTTEELTNAVLANELDGALVIDFDKEVKLAKEYIIDEELVLMMNASHPPLTSYKDLQNQTLLLLRQGCRYRARLERWLTEEQIIPHKKIEFYTIENLLGCMRSGMGVALVSRSMIDKLVQEGWVRSYPIPKQYRKESIVFICKEEAVETLEPFVAIIKDYFRQYRS